MPLVDMNMLWCLSFKKTNEQRYLFLQLLCVYGGELCRQKQQLPACEDTFSPFARTRLTKSNLFLSTMRRQGSVDEPTEEELAEGLIKTWMRRHSRQGCQQDDCPRTPWQQPPSPDLRRHWENFLFSYFQAASASLTNHGCHEAWCQKVSSLAASPHGLKKYILDYLYHLSLTGVLLGGGGRRRAPEGTRIERKVFYRAIHIVAAVAGGGRRRRKNGY